LKVASTSDACWT